MSYICMKMKNHFHIDGVAVSLALKWRLEATRKWSIRLPLVTGKRAFHCEVYDYREF